MISQINNLILILFLIIYLHQYNYRKWNFYTDKTRIGHAGFTQLEQDIGPAGFTQIKQE